MKLNGKQIKRLHQALLSAFPTPDALRRMVRMELDENLWTIVGGDDLSAIVFNLIQWATSQGRIEELIAKAHTMNPGNCDLRHISDTILGATTMHCADTSQSPEEDTSEETLMLVVSGEIKNVHLPTFKALAQHFKDITGTELRITVAKQGSIIFMVKGPPDALNLLKDMFAQGRLFHIGDFHVEDVRLPNDSDLISEAAQEQRCSALLHAIEQQSGMPDQIIYELVAALLPHMSTVMIERSRPFFLRIARQLSKDNPVLSAAIASYLPEPQRSQVYQEVLNAVLSITADYTRFEALIGLAPYLPEMLLSQVLNAIINIKEDHTRAELLIGLAPYLQGSLLPQALNAALNLDMDDRRTQALIALAPHLQEPLLSQTLTVALSMKEDYRRAQALIALAPHLPEPQRSQVFQEALNAALSIKADYRRIEILTALAPHLPERLWPQALDAALNIKGNYRRTQVLIALAPHLPEPLWPQALDAALSIKTDYRRIEILTALAPHLPERLWPQALDAALDINDDYERTQVLTTFAPHLPASLWPQVLDAALSMKEDYRRAEALIALDPYLPEPQRSQVYQKALDVALSIKENDKRTEVLTALASHLPEPLLPQVLNAALNIGGYSRAEVLTALAPHLPEPQRSQAYQQALISAEGITWSRDRALALTALAPHLPEPQRSQTYQKALTATLSMKQEIKEFSKITIGTRDLQGDDNIDDEIDQDIYFNQINSIINLIESVIIETDSH